VAIARMTNADDSINSSKSGHPADPLRANDAILGPATAQLIWGCPKRSPSSVEGMNPQNHR
jgi:hypothetical protein